MTTQTERDALRKLAEAWRDYKVNNLSNAAEHIGMLFTHKRNFEKAVTPTAVIELLDENDAQALRIAALEATAATWKARSVSLKKARDTLRASFDELAAAVGWTKERGEQTGDSPMDVANATRTELEVLRGREAVNPALCVYLFNQGYRMGHNDTVEGAYTDVHHSDMRTYQSDVVVEILRELPESDYLAAPVALAQPAQGVNAGLVGALVRIADAENYGADGIWDAESYPDEIARTALADAKAAPVQSRGAA